MISASWLAGLALRRQCTQCGMHYRDVDNFGLSCPQKTHVDRSIRLLRKDDYGAILSFGEWRCCELPTDERYTRMPGCVAADHTSDQRPRRLRPDNELLEHVPSAVWFQLVGRDNRTVLMDGNAATRVPSDEEVREYYSRSEIVYPIVVARFDWRNSAARREKAAARGTT